jgi:hypothetical protein
MSPFEQAIVTTLLYSHLFSFPLTYDELWQFLISEKAISKRSFDLSLRRLMQGKVQSVLLTENHGYYCFHGNESCIALREKNIPEVERKMVQARSIAKKLSWIPTILFIGISGGLAARDVTEYDDIDLFLITKKNTLFTSRFLVLILLGLLGVRRFYGQRHAGNSICVNLLIDETALSWSKDTHDVYTAREMAQVIPLFEREDCYARFLRSNLWVRDFLPQSTFKQHQFSVQQKTQKNHFLFAFFERILRFIQISYMQKHKTTEIVKNNYLAFHPNDYRFKMMTKLKEEMQGLGLLTKI